MKVKCFGIAKEITSVSILEIPDQVKLTNVAQLKTWIIEQYPGFKNIKNCMIAVNQNFADNNHLINNNDELAIIPPVSGG